MSNVITLPAPFEDVTLEWHDYTSGIELAYVGLPHRLIECGAIEPHMTEKAARKRPVRTDSRGHHFTRQTLQEWRLKIVRTITDEAFAYTLPGVPRMTFDELDWLDAHPGCLHIEEDENEPGGRRWRKRFTAGAIAALVKAGFPEILFTKKWSLTRTSRWGQSDNVPRELKYATVSKLMRGYFEVEQSWNEGCESIYSLPEAVVMAKPMPPARVAPVSHLRLVWTNPTPA